MLRKIAQVLEVISKPGYCIYEWFDNLQSNNTVQLIICSLPALIGPITIFATMWPISSILEFLAALLFSFLMTGLFIALFDFIFFALVNVLKLLFYPWYKINFVCFEYMCKHPEFEKRKHSMGKGAKADIDLRYFIGKAKETDPYNAEFINWN